MNVCGYKCPNCVYIGEGDFMCSKFSFDELVIVLTDFSCPTEDYLKCEKENNND